MKFTAEDEFVTVVVRMTPEAAAEFERQYIENEESNSFEIVAVGSLPDPHEEPPCIVRGCACRSKQ